MTLYYFGTLALGLFTHKANEIGTLSGIVVGIVAKDETIIFGSKLYTVPSLPSQPATPAA